MDLIPKLDRVVSTATNKGATNIEPSAAPTGSNPDRRHGSAGSRPLAMNP